MCYFDSGYRQKKLYDKPQYGYIIFWGGGPIIWKSKRHSQIPQSVSQAEFETITHAWRDIKWVRELIKELGLGKWVERPTPMIGDNQNSITWSKEDMMADGNRHFEHKYFTVRERVALGEIALYWLSGKLNPADVTTIGNSLIPSVIRTHTPKQTTSTIRGTTPIRPAPLFSLLALPINEATQSCCCMQIVGVASSAPVVGTPRVNRTGRSTSHIVSRYCVSK